MRRVVPSGDLVNGQIKEMREGEERDTPLGALEVVGLFSVDMTAHIEWRGGRDPSAGGRMRHRITLFCDNGNIMNLGRGTDEIWFAP